MSLLRRGNRFHPNDTWTNDAQFPLPDLSNEETDIAWRLRWSHGAPGRLLALAMTRDGQHIVAGSRGGWVLFYDSTGRLLWRSQVEGAVHRIALAEDARCVLVGTAEQGHAAHLFHFDGRRLRTFEAESEAWGIDLLPDASLIAVGGMNQRVTLYNRAGDVLAMREVGGSIRHAAFLPGGDGVLVCGDDGVIYALDRAGYDLWQHRTEGRLWAGACVAQNTDLILAGSNDRHVYALDHQGHVLWSYDTGGLVNAVAVTPDGQYCAAAGSANTVFLFDAGGQMLWSHTLEQLIHTLSLSADGRFTLLSTDDNALHVFDHEQDHRLRSYEAGGRTHALALTPDGRTFAAAITMQGVHVFDRLLAPPDEAVSAGNGLLSSGYGPAQHLVERAVVRRVRDDYARDCHAGLVRWFTEFQRSLRGRQYGVCQALLDEIGDARSYSLNAGERQVIGSLEGVRWLFEGVDHHHRRDFEAARVCYERSKTIQASINNKDGLGQVIAALSALPAPTAERVAAVEPALVHVDGTQTMIATEVATGSAVEDDAGTVADDAAAAEYDAVERLLDDIVRRPRILGTSEKLLEQRLIGATPPEQLQIIVLARRAGYLLPLLRGLEAEERLVRAAASAALTFLSPGPDDDVLAQMLQSPQSFVRWNAVRMMLNRAENHPEQFEASKPRLWPVALNPETFQSLDALARREVALLVECAGTSEDTAWLVDRLADPDTDVQLAAVDALAKVGTRDALAALDHVPDNRGFLGRELVGVAKEAASAIESRHPLPSISRVYFCATDPLANRRVTESTLFFTDAENVYCVVDVDHVQPGAQIGARWSNGSMTLGEENRVLTEDLPLVASVQELGPGGRSSPFARPGSTPRFGTAPPANDGPTRRPGLRPYGSPGDDRPAEVPSFLRRDPAATPPRPGASRPDAARPDAARPSAPRPSAPRPAAQPADRPAGSGGLGRFFSRQGTESSPRPAADRPSPFRRTEDAGDRPVRPGLPLTRRRFPSIFDADDRPMPSRSPLGRSLGEPVADPFINTEPSQGDEDRSPAALSRSPFARRDAPESPARSRPGGDLPDWLLTEDEEDNGLFGGSRRSPGRYDRPGERSAGRSPFGGPRASDDDEEVASGGDQADSRPWGARQFSRNGTITRLAFALPRPETGWPETVCQFEIELVNSGASAARTSFRFVNVPQITRLEPGFLPAGRGATFKGARRFLTATKQIACQVHLADAPANTSLRGRCYDVQTGTLLGETSARSSSEGNSTVLLQWPNGGWPAASYRIEVDVEGSRLTPSIAPQVNQRQITIDLIEHVSVKSVSVCHRVDDQNGPIGVGWPFKTGDSPWCVVELDDLASEVKVQATWYSQSEMLHRSEPITPMTEMGQRAAFHLECTDDQPLAPGFYSVVIDGDHVPRQEQVFEVQPRDWWTRIKPYAGAVRDALQDMTAGLYPIQFLTVLGGVLLFALALAGVAEVLREVLHASDRGQDAILRLGQLVGAGGGWWALAWVIAGGAYSALYVRICRQLSDIREQGLFKVLNLALVLVGATLLWYELSYVLFVPSYTQPDALAGIFGAVRWMAPVLAWCGLPVGLVLVDWYRVGGNSKPFTIAGLSVAIMLAALAAAGYVGLTIVGLIAALVGAIPGGSLSLFGVENRVVRGFMVAGASGGFLLAVSAYAFPSFKALWRKWQTAQQERPDSAEARTLLDYGLARMDITRRLWLRFGFAPVLLCSALSAVAIIVMSVSFERVVVPVLDALYDPIRREAFEQVLHAQPAIPVMALTLWMVWPVMVVSGYRAALAVEMNIDAKRRLRGGTLLALLAGFSVPVAIALISRTELVRELAPESLIFWANRMAALLVSLSSAGVIVITLWRDLLASRTSLGRSASAEIWTGLGAVGLLAVLWPFWMWALAVGIVFSAVVIGTLVLGRFR